MDSLLPLPCQPLLDQRQWISISGLNSAKANNSINILAITGSVPVDSPLPQPCRPLLDLASVDSQLYSSCLNHVGHHWISISGLTALLELPLPPCRPSLDQRQWTRHFGHHWINVSGLTAASTMSAITSGLTALLKLPLPPCRPSLDAQADNSTKPSLISLCLQCRRFRSSNIQESVSDWTVSTFFVQNIGS